MTRRVVVTGMGVVAPNGVGLDAFRHALEQGKSGIRKIPELESLGFRCTVGGVPAVSDKIREAYLTNLDRTRIKADGIRYGVLAAAMAWEHARLIIPDKEHAPDWESGAIFGAGMPGAEVVAESVRNVDSGSVKRLGSLAVPNTMASGVSAYIGGKLALGNRVSTNASACSTGTEAILMGFDHIRSGRASRMLCGGCDSAGPMVRAGFDAMRVLNQWSNHAPEEASRPMSASARGFIPSGGAGALVLESLESARERHAPIYAEVLGGAINSGGQRNGGSMTAPNPDAVIRCIRHSIEHAGLKANDIDAISGHLTATYHDPSEIDLWCRALERKGKNFPKINALKSLTGHCLSAAGAIEAIACILQLHHAFLHPSVNCTDLHPEIECSIHPNCIPFEKSTFNGNVMISSSFGFGDVNSCVILRKW